MQDAIIAADDESRIVFWSPSAARVFGRSRDEALGRPLTMLMPERFRDAHLAGLRRVLDGGEPHVLGGPPAELVGLRADGEEFPIELTLGRWTGEGGGCFTGVVRDVSERHHAYGLLATQHAVAVALASSQDLDQGMADALRAIGEGLGWGAGQLWIADTAAGVLRCRVVWHAEPEALEALREASLATVFEPGVGLPGRVWQTGTTAWLADVLDDDNFLRRDVAERVGLHAGVALPLAAEGVVHGAVEFFSPEVRPARDGDVVAMEAVAQQLGQFLLRREAEAQVAGHERRQRQAAELNDEVVQGLALAQYHLEREDDELAATTIAATLAAAKEIVSDLLAGDDVGPGDLRRSDAANIGRERP